jgi:PhzF family phenazine biosynthesis protein
MRIPMWQVDAFADRVFTGNPAAVCLLEAWLPDETLAAIAAENNLSETAFLVKEPQGWRIRWFTPEVEIDLCGHATLASAHVVLTRLEPAAAVVTFASQSGPLTIARAAEGRLAMTFPRRPGKRCAVPPGLERLLKQQPLETLAARDLLVVVGNEADVRGVTLDAPALAALSALPYLGVIVTAPASTPGLDFVSRFFCPNAGIAEDPVTGSAHCTLVPYWSRRLGRRALEAAQLSKRGGRLTCEDGEETVTIAGRAVGYLEGTIEV